MQFTVQRFWNFSKKTLNIKFKLAAKRLNMDRLAEENTRKFFSRIYMRCEIIVYFWV